MTIQTAPNILTTIDTKIDYLKHTNCDILNNTIENLRKCIHRLSNFLKYIDIEDLESSNYSTVWLVFRKEGVSISLDIGKTTLAHVIDRNNKFTSGNGKINDKSYWNKLIDIFKNEFKD